MTDDCKTALTFQDLIFSFFFAHPFYGRLFPLIWPWRQHQGGVWLYSDRVC